MVGDEESSIYLDLSEMYTGTDKDTTGTMHIRKQGSLANATELLRTISFESFCHALQNLKSMDGSFSFCEREKESP